MKTCPTCGELNGTDARQCFKCHKSFGPADSYRKICPKCQSIYSSRAETCDRCGVGLSVYSGEVSERIVDQRSNGSCGLYVVSVLIPLVGIILGLIYIARGEDELGKSYIMTSVITWVVVAVLGLVLGSCSGLF